MSNIKEVKKFEESYCIHCPGEHCSDTKVNGETCPFWTPQYYGNCVPFKKFMDGKLYLV